MQVIQVLIRHLNGTEDIVIVPIDNGETPEFVAETIAIAGPFDMVILSGTNGTAYSVAKSSIAAVLVELVEAVEA